VTGSNDAHIRSMGGHADAHVNAWVEWLRAARGRSERTVTEYERVVRDWVDSGSDDMEAWLQRERRGRARGSVAAPATQHKDSSALRSFYGWLHARGLIERDPTLLVSTPTIRNVQPKPILDTAWKSLWTSVSGPSRVMLGLGFFCGLRRAEMVALRTSHFDLATRRITNFVRKGGGEDSVPMGTMLDVFTAKLPHLGPELFWPALVDHLASRPGDSLLLTQAALGGAHDAACGGQYLNNWMAREARWAGVGHVTPHMLRHSCATNLLRAGVPVALVSGLLNHAAIQTTMRYLKVGGDELRDWLVTAQS